MRKWEQDKKVRGLGLMTLPSGVRTWYLRFRDNHGKQRHQALGRADTVNRTFAREQALKILGDLARGIHQVQGSATVADLVDLMEKRHYPNLRRASVTAYRCYWKNDVLPVLGQHKVSKIQRSEIIELLTAIKGAKRNRILQMLRSAFNQAEMWELRPDGSNPCKRIKPQPEKLRVRYLTQDELARLLDACEKFAVTPLRWRFTQLIKLLLHTGARRDEIRAAKWDWYKPETATLVIPSESHKTGGDGRQRTIHLSLPAVEALEELRNQATSVWIIAGQDDGPLVGVGKMWRQLLQRAGIHNLRIHDLRHSYASFAADARLTLLQVGGLLGHASPTTTARYVHLFDKTSASAAAKVSTRIKNPR